VLAQKDNHKDTAAAAALDKAQGQGFIFFFLPEPSEVDL
jgi:hypothetical protein